MHKNPKSLRMIAGVANVEVPVVNNHDTWLQKAFYNKRSTPIYSTTSASKKLSRALQDVMTLLQEKDDIFFERHHCRRCWFIRSGEEVFFEIKQNLVLYQGKEPRTYDFTTMYTCLQHDKILRNMRTAISEAISYQRQRTKATPVIRDLPNLNWFIEHIEFLISNIFLSNNAGKLKQQVVGLPMGTNAAPEIANLTLYADEAEFIDDLIRRGERLTAMSYSRTRRFIDDLLTWDNDPPPEELYGMSYKRQTEPDGSVTFLGAKIRKLHNGHIILSVFDKTKEWNFPVIRYTHGTSNAPSFQSTAIFIGQTCRYKRICSTIKEFKAATSSLTLRMIERKHSPVDIKKGFRIFLQRHTDSRMNKPALQHWFRRMLKWAMCQRTDPFTVIVDNRPQNEVQGQILEVAAYENIIHEQNVQHTDSDHESEVIERSLTSTSSQVVSEAERHDRHNGSVFDNDEATVIDTVTNQSTTASSLTENRDSEDVDTFDSIVSREIGEREDDLRDDISDLSTDDTLRNTAAEENFTQTQVGSNASNVRQSPTQERPDHSNTIDQRDNRPDEDYDDDEVINPSIYYIYHIMERYLEILY